MELSPESRYFSFSPKACAKHPAIPSIDFEEWFTNVPRLVVES